MRTDIEGCSTCLPGQERHEAYYSATMKGRLIQYEYRTPDGRLFSCIARDLIEARAKRAAWLEQEVPACKR